MEDYKRRFLIMAFASIGVMAIFGAVYGIINNNNTDQKVPESSVETKPNRNTKISIPKTSSDEEGSEDEATSTALPSDEQIASYVNQRTYDGVAQNTGVPSNTGSNSGTDAPVNPGTPVSPDTPANPDTPTEPETPTEPDPTDPADPTYDDYIHEGDGVELSDEVVYMQSFDYSRLGDMNYDSEYEIVDARDGKAYTIKKVQMNRRDYVAMVEDLQLGSTEKPMVLTPAYSNVKETTILPKSSDIAELDESSNEPNNSINIDGDTYLYSPIAALAGKDDSSKLEAYNAYNGEVSICPKGWRLPAVMEDYVYRGYDTETDFSEETYAVSNGYGDETHYASSTWRRFVNNDAVIYAHASDGFHERSVADPQNVHVRCIFGAPLYEHAIVTYDGNGGTLEFAGKEGMDRISVGESYTKASNDYWEAMYPSLAVYHQMPYPKFEVSNWGGPSPTREGYIFFGWALDKNATTPDYTADSYIGFNEDITLYAVWISENDTVTITRNSNGYVEPVDSETIYGGREVVEINQNDFTKLDGNVYIAKINAHGVCEYSNSTVMRINYNLAAGDKLYIYNTYEEAEWFRDDEVAIDANGLYVDTLTGSGAINLDISTESSVGIILVKSGNSTLNIKAIGGRCETESSKHWWNQGGFESQGYRLLGWSTDPNATEPTYGTWLYDNDGLLPIDFITENTTLYAIWEQPNSITLNVAPSNFSDGSTTRTYRYFPSSDAHAEVFTTDDDEVKREVYYRDGPNYAFVKLTEEQKDAGARVCVIEGTLPDIPMVRACSGASIDTSRGGTSSVFKDNKISVYVDFGDLPAGSKIEVYVSGDIAWVDDGDMEFSPQDQDSFVGWSTAPNTATPEILPDELRYYMMFGPKNSTFYAAYAE